MEDRKGKTGHKKEDKTESENFGPLTMLSIPSKTVDSVACISLDMHLENSIHKNKNVHTRRVFQQNFHFIFILTFLSMVIHSVIYCFTGSHAKQKPNNN